MEDIDRRVFNQIDEILKHSSDEILKKLPKNLQEFLKENKEKDYKPNIDFNTDNWQDYLLEDTIVLMGLIYRDYIVSKDERQKLLLEEEIEYNEKYNPNNIFKNKKNIQNQIKEIQPRETAIIEYKEKNFLQKIFDKIKHLFNK